MLTIDRVDQFDFLLATGGPIPASEDTLETVTLMWDLGKALDGAKNRQDSIKALAIHETLRARDNRRNLLPILHAEQSTITIPRGFPVPIALQGVYADEESKAVGDRRAPKTVKWTVKQVLQRGSRPGEVTVHELGKAPIGISEKGLLTARAAEPGTYTLHVCLTDDIGNVSSEPQELTLPIGES